MRGLGRFSSSSTAKLPFSASSSHCYSAMAGSGRGRGRGGASPPPPISSTVENPAKIDESTPPKPGLGHGRGAHPPPSFSAPGRGRGSPLPPSDPKKPLFFRREDLSPAKILDPGIESEAPDRSRAPPVPGIGRGKASILDAEPSRVPLNLSVRPPGGGIGRGKASIPSISEVPGAAMVEENRHLRSRAPAGQLRDREEATRRAIGVLSRGAGGRGVAGRGGVVGGAGWRGRGGRGGRGGRFGGRGQARDIDEYYGTGLFLGNAGDGEKLAKRVGEETMAKLNEAFEEMSSHVLPSPMEEVYLEALHTNYSFEFEPEFHMVFTNPDIEEKPPVALPEALEKMKPFLMEYEGIQSQKEWEDIMEETMKKAPVLKELVDFYSGPDRVTAKQQDQELERVANTIPDDVPSSVKRFTDRALISLKSNSGWGFGKKCQFMDKLTWEISQQYK
ncbi:hydroxyproline-rich glycoprotein family protein [Wolffia australiana]